MIWGVVLAFASSTEHAGNEFQGWPVVVGEFDQAKILATGQPAFNCGHGNGVGCEHASVDELRIQ